MSRVKAFTRHVLLSFIIFTVVVSALVFFWYPAPFFMASGGWQGLKIAAGVDLVLGPLLTLIIFDIKKTKAKLVGDLIVIGLLQFSALAWGMSTIYQQRPVAVVFWETEFLTVPASALVNQNIDLSTLTQFGEQKPVYVYVEKPQNSEQLMLMANQILEEGIPPHHFVDMYRPLRDYYTDLKPFQVDIDEIITVNSQLKSDLEHILMKSKTAINDYDYFALRSKYHSIILMFHQGELKNYLVVPQ